MTVISSTNGIIMYGTSWCFACRRARSIMDQNQIQYQWVDIDQNEDGRNIIVKINHGMRSVPTIIFPDGSIMVEPDKVQLMNKLGL